MAVGQLPAIGGEGGLALYLQQIRRFPLLDADEEYVLAKAWRAHGDLASAHKLVTSHLRLVAKIAFGYRNYGLPLSDLIAEGNIGMMQAVKRFDPERGFRLATYALWWIRASIQEYVLRSWSLVKIGTTAAQKKLFFNLRRLKRDMRAIDDGDLSPEQVKSIARTLVVSEQDVVDMNGRLIAADASLNAPMSADGEGEWLDVIADDTESHETRMGREQEQSIRQRMLALAIQSLNDRERAIIMARRMQDPAATLEDLSQQMGVSRERIRQIESRAFEKLQANIKEQAEVEGVL